MNALKLCWDRFVFMYLPSDLCLKVLNIKRSTKRENKQIFKIFLDGLVTSPLSACISYYKDQRNGAVFTRGQCIFLYLFLNMFFIRSFNI